MMKNSTKLLLSLGLTLLSYNAQASCSAVATELMDYVANGNDYAYRWIDFQMTLNDHRRHGTFSEGSLGHASYGRGLLNLEQDKLSGTFTTLFSDRHAAVGRQFQPFNILQADSTRLEIRRDGSIDVSLLTWGGSKLSLGSVTCWKDAWGYYIQARKYSSTHGNGILMILLERSGTNLG